MRCKAPSQSPTATIDRVVEAFHFNDETAVLGMLKISRSITRMYSNETSCFLARRRRRSRYYLEEWMVDEASERTEER